MKIIFMGTPEFSVSCLERLVADGYEVILAVCQPDKPKGRGNKMTPPPVKEFALSRGIPVYQPKTLRTDEAYEALLGYPCDLIVTAAYGKILPQRVLDLPEKGCVNVHASLLPKYRGAAPVQWAVLNGERETGVTTMRMDAGVDTGDMLERAVFPIPPEMSAGELFDALATVGADLLSSTLKKLEADTLCPEKQDDALSCYAPMLTKELSPLDFTRPAQVLHDQIRGLDPWPTATCLFDGKVLKVLTSRVGEATDAAPGTVVSVKPFAVACGDRKTLLFGDVQYEGGRRMPMASFLCGHPAAVGTVLDGGTPRE